MSDHRIITVDQMRAIDAACPALGVPTLTLMENAGAAVAREIIKRHAPCKVAVLCGPGNNGGDGWVAARHLREAGFDAWVETLVEPSRLTGDAAVMAARYQGPVFAISENNPMADLFVDALFGAGLSRALEKDAARLANALPPERVVAVDVPSGLPGDGEAPTGPCFRAHLTVTFVRKKPAHVLMPGLDLCGEVNVADIGAPEAAVQAVDLYAEENAPALWTLPTVARALHKHARGRVAIWAGPAGASLSFGAQRLAATAAARMGAGWVSVLLDDPAHAVFFTQPMALMTQLRSDAELARFGAIVIGPGTIAGPAIQRALCTATAAARPLVIDGGALDDFSGLALPPGSVVTPHAGEFARMAPDLATGSKIERAKALAKRLNAVVAFKGPDTVIAAPDGRARVNIHATPHLATAGTGDVLAGMIAALIAQGMDAFNATCAAVWLHGEAGIRCGPGLIADDLLAQLPAALATLSV